VVKLQRQKTRVVNGKEYFRWTVIIPPKRIDELGWNEGTQLESKTKKGRLVLKRVKTQS
jgi:formylmethanofuran dehydrogenase subunit D